MSQNVLAAPPAWQRDKARANRVLPVIKRICGEYLIGEAPEEEDSERNTDLIVLRLDAVRIACRVRTWDYLWQRDYRNEFTIRAGRPTGTKTELAKVIEGYGDYIFYGFSDAQGEGLAAWLLGDLKVFRLWLMRELAKNKQMPGTELPNHDGSSSFRVFSINTLPNEFIVARKYPDASNV